MTEIINSFTPPYSFLSSFYMKAPLFDENGIPFKSVHQALIAKFTDDLDIKKMIAAMKSPEEIRAFGMSLTERRSVDDWQIQVMFELNLRKFTEYPILGDKLKETKPAKLQNRLLYNDPFWGIYKGVGRDELGKILMEIRDKHL